MDRGEKEVVDIHRSDDVETFGSLFLEAFELFGDIVDNFGGIRSGHLHDHGGATDLAVDCSVEAV